MTLGDLVVIATDVEDEDNSKLYVKTESGWNFSSDMSGMKGVGIASTVLDADGNFYITYTDGSTTTIGNDLYKAMVALKESAAQSESAAGASARDSAASAVSAQSYASDALVSKQSAAESADKAQEVYNTMISDGGAILKEAKDYTDSQLNWGKIADLIKS